MFPAACGIMTRGGRVVQALAGAQVRQFGLALRLEVFYQHYARHCVMNGEEPLAREAWWPFVLLEDPSLAAVIAFDDVVLSDASGARL
jgi:hypothetical protein